MLNYTHPARGKKLINAQMPTLFMCRCLQGALKFRTSWKRCSVHLLLCLLLTSRILKTSQASMELLAEKVGELLFHLSCSLIVENIILCCINWNSKFDVTSIYLHLKIVETLLNIRLEPVFLYSLIYFSSNPKYSEHF